MKKLLLIAAILLTVVGCTHGIGGHGNNDEHNTRHHDSGHNTH